MKSTKTILASLICILGFSTGVDAKELGEQQASELVQKTFKPEKLLKVQAITERGNKLFKVRMMTDGRVKTVYVDRANGKVSENKP